MCLSLDISSPPTTGSETQCFTRELQKVLFLSDTGDSFVFPLLSPFTEALLYQHGHLCVRAWTGDKTCWDKTDQLTLTAPLFHISQHMNTKNTDFLIKEAKK